MSSDQSTSHLELLPCPECGEDVVMSSPTRQVLGHLTLKHTGNTDQPPETAQDLDDPELKMLLKGVHDSELERQIRHMYGIQKRMNREAIRKTLSFVKNFRSI